MKCFQANRMCHLLWQWCLEDPRRIVRAIILFACSIIVIFQLAECFKKLLHPPIATHSHFDLNETMSYPAVTFCREPPYKSEVLSSEYGLSFHPSFTSHWRNFNFNSNSLEEVFTQSTYGYDEFFNQLGLSGNVSNVRVASSLHFNMGLCFTVNPLIKTRGAWKDFGYSIMLEHNLTDNSQSLTTINPGWHVFIHEEAEKFSENRMQRSGRVEYVYVEAEEDIEIKLAVQHFTMLENSDNRCNNEINYSAIQCGEDCRWRDITANIGCTAPWIPNINLPTCNTFNQIREFVNIYNRNEDDNYSEPDSECECPRPCNSVLYSAYVMNRKAFIQPIPRSQVYLYYTSKMVSVIEERIGYDLSQFVADMGGSLGFLLGLSVIGLIKVFEKLSVFIAFRYLPKYKKETPDDDKNKIRNDNASIFSTETTLDVVIHKDKL